MAAIERGRERDLACFAIKLHTAVESGDPTYDDWRGKRGEEGEKRDERQREKSEVNCVYPHRLRECTLLNWRS